MQQKVKTPGTGKPETAEKIAGNKLASDAAQKARDALNAVALQEAERKAEAERAAKKKVEVRVVERRACCGCCR